MGKVFWMLPLSDWYGIGMVVDEWGSSFEAWGFVFYESTITNQQSRYITLDFGENFCRIYAQSLSSSDRSFSAVAVDNQPMEITQNRFRIKKLTDLRIISM
ncbi:hypothetical protein OSB04_031076 [Centaurea solstitialis]|uniref:Uncharacterized protein n=1 Tax=Centaurea solstitialis TaxID=347529 RepID=A0AA38SU07_9ASTR|nr:hypothetical protein OSB04_031076 [Centaurea solstitialis]